jgi:hypothetical protein
VVVMSNTMMPSVTETSLFPVPNSCMYRRTTNIQTTCCCRHT